MTKLNQITLILGGARSGKSSHAQKLAEAIGASVTYLATAEALDDEMSRRIQTHRAERPSGWETLEVPHNIATHVPQIRTDVVILDCITLLMTNLMMQYVQNDLVDEELFMSAVHKEIDGLVGQLRERKQAWIIISNEVGLGLVPAYQMGRVYRDAIGWANQRLAREADTVLFMMAGIPMVVKA